MFLIIASKVKKSFMLKRKKEIKIEDIIWNKMNISKFILGLGLYIIVSVLSEEVILLNDKNTVKIIRNDV